MSRTYRLGFIGGGLNSAVGTTHFIASQMDKRFSVEAGCFSKDSGVNQETAEHWGVGQNRCYSTMRALLESERGNLDALVVLLPTPQHVEAISAAFEFGYPVISEKALAGSVSDVRKILSLRNKYKTFLAVTYNYVGYPMLRELKAMIEGGRLGRLEQIHIEMPQEGFLRLGRDGRPSIPQQWRLQDGEIPTISLDLGVHVHHMISFLSGQKPVSVVATQTSRGSFQQVCDNTMCIARYTNDLECNIWFSKAALGYRNGLRVRVFGEVGSAEWYQLDPENLVFHDNLGRTTIIDRANVDVTVAHLLQFNRFKAGHPAGFMEAFANLYSDIADGLSEYLESAQNVISDSFSPQLAYEGIAFLDAVSTSAKSGQWVSVKYCDVYEG